MDGRDNLFIERLWRSVKYQDIYLKAYSSLGELRGGPQLLSILVLDMTVS